MSKVKLTAEQMAELAPLERHFKQAVEAHFCSPVPNSQVEMLLDVWKELTGAARVGYRPGCSICTFHLVRDLAVLYFARKAELAEAAKPKVEQKPAERAEKAPESAKNSPANKSPQPKAIKPGEQAKKQKRNDKGKIRRSPTAG